MNCGARLSGDESPPEGAYVRKRPGRLDKSMRTALVVGIVILIVAMTVMGLAVTSFFTGKNLSTPQTTTIGWMARAGFGDPQGMADFTIAAVIGGNPFSQTVSAYTSLLAPYHGQTKVNLLNLQVTAKESLDSAQREVAESAVALLQKTYGLPISDYCFVHFWLTGLGHISDPIDVGLLQMGSKWYIGYAEGVVNLGGI